MLGKRPVGYFDPGYGVPVKARQLSQDSTNGYRHPQFRVAICEWNIKKMV